MKKKKLDLLFVVLNSKNKTVDFITYLMQKLYLYKIHSPYGNPSLFYLWLLRGAEVLSDREGEFFKLYVVTAYCAVFFCNTLNFDRSMICHYTTNENTLKETLRSFCSFINNNRCSHTSMNVKWGSKTIYNSINAYN